jgi:hypothetical protein
MTIFVPDVEPHDKTRHMYGALTPADFSDGHMTHAVAAALRHGLTLNESQLVNTFDSHVGYIAPTAAKAMAACRAAGLAVHATGSGPGFFALTNRAEIPTALLHELQREWGVRAFACRALNSAEALAVREV